MKKIVDGIVQNMTPEEEAALRMDEPSDEMSPSELREQAYNTTPVIAWGGAMLTVTEAAQQWAYYAAEGNAEKMDALTALIAAEKAEIRAKYPDNAGGT